MTGRPSPNTQATLLLTAPLMVGGKPAPGVVKPLSPGEYRDLVRRLRQAQREPSDLLQRGGVELARECRVKLEPRRLEQLLARGFLLSQAMERWSARAIWVAGWDDPAYPQTLTKRLGEDSPALLYGCGDSDLLDAGGLAVVGSRDVSQALVEYTHGIGRLAAAAGRNIVSGGARGVDEAAMRGALEAGGCVVGVLAHGLEEAALHRHNRDALIDGRLALACPYDPATPFLAGHALGRNKLIYALADAALVVAWEYEMGGTWAGATEALRRLKEVPVYVRATGETGMGLAGLRDHGAVPWPEPVGPEALRELLNRGSGVVLGPEEPLLPLEWEENDHKHSHESAKSHTTGA